MACLCEISKKELFCSKTCFLVKNHCSWYIWLSWRSYDDKRKKKFVTRDNTNFSSMFTVLDVVSISQVCFAILQYIRLSNKAFVLKFALQMEFCVRNCWKCYRRLDVNRLYQKHLELNGAVHSKAVEMWCKICLALVGHQRL